MKVKIISDSTCDLSSELIQKYGIAITPLSIALGGVYLKDGSEIRPDAIYTYLRNHSKAALVYLFRGEPPHCHLGGMENDKSLPSGEILTIYY